MRQRLVLVMLLVYVTLDLSLPAMPGAFVFDLDGSVESTQVVRLRATTEKVALPALTFGHGFAMVQPALPEDGLGPARPPVERLRWRLATWRPPTLTDAAASSEDPL